MSRLDIRITMPDGNEYRAEDLVKELLRCGFFIADSDERNITALDANYAFTEREEEAFGGNLITHLRWELIRQFMPHLADLLPIYEGHGSRYTDTEARRRYGDGIRSARVAFVPVLMEEVYALSASLPRAGAEGGDEPVGDVVKVRRGVVPDYSRPMSGGPEGRA